VEVLRQRRERADWKGAQMIAQWLLQLDPLNEDATLALAECAALAGSKAEAVAILDRYLAELGPSAGDIRLPATLLRRRFAEPPQRRRSVALMTAKYFFGREEELAECTMSLRRARWHDGSAVLVYGPPGMGKSRLVAEMVKVAQLEGYRDVVVECRESLNGRPLGALIEALPELLSAPGSIGCAPESLAVLRKLLGPESGEAATAVDETEAEPVGALSPAERIDRALRTMRAQSIRHAVVDLFAAVSDERPIFLLVEDVQWLDDPSWEVLADVIQRVNEMRVYIILTSRFASVREERPSRLPTPLTYRKLPPLGEAALQALVRSAADDDGVVVPEPVERWIIGGCEGNPLMLRALLEHWAATGNAEGVPPSLTTLIDQRIDRLDAHAQQALSAISLLGQFASLERIKLVLELPVHELIHALEQLELSGCLSTSHASLVITHELVRWVALRRMSPLVETALRASIADTLESEYSRTSDLEVLLEALVHTHLSGRFDVLHRFIHQHDEALILGDRPATVLKAIESLHENIPRARQERRVARLQLNQESKNGASGRALALLPGGLVIPADPADLSDEETDECLSYIDAAYRSSPIADPDVLAQFAAGVACNSGAAIHLRIRATDICLTISSNTCDEAIARRSYLGLELPEQRLQEDERTQNIALVYNVVFGSVETAVRMADELIRRNEDSRLTTRRVVECGRAGYVYRMTGRHSKAIAALTRARELALEIEAPRLAEYPIWQLAQLTLESGDVASALRWTAELQQLGEKNLDDAANTFIHAHLCLMSIAQGNRREAEVHYRKVQRTLTARRPVRTLAFAVGLELGVGLMDRRWQPSASLLETALRRFSQSCAFCASDFLASRIGEAMYRAGRIDETVELMSSYMMQKRREQAAPTAFLRPVLHKLGIRH
jgi:tetratricopeptide (TPR) repeat protein